MRRDLYCTKQDKYLHNLDIEIRLRLKVGE